MKSIHTVSLLLILTLRLGSVQASQISALPASGIPGAEVSLRGGVPADQPELRFYWEQAGELRPAARGTAAANGGFAVNVAVPADARSGPARWAVLPAARPARELTFADFEVVDSAPARLVGTVRDTAGEPVGTGISIRLLDASGLHVAEALTDRDGQFVFPGLASGRYVVQTAIDGYVPAEVTLTAGGSADLVVGPVALDQPVPPLMLVGAGGIALPGGVFTGTQPVKVGDWTEIPMARLVSLKGKGLAPLKVRFWVELQRLLLSQEAPLVVVFQFMKGGQEVANVAAGEPTQLFSQSPFNFPAYVAEFNSFELPPGKLTLVVTAVTTLFGIAGQWQFPIEVVDLGTRWYAGNVESPSLSVTKEDPFRLRYEFKGTLPGGLPGVGTPLFSYPMDLKFRNVQNEFDLGISLTERFHNDGNWSGQAKALANVILLGIPVINESRALNLHGAALPGATYALPPWTVPIGDVPPIPIWGAVLPSPIHVCGLKFNGEVGIVLDVGGNVSLSGDVKPDLRTTATVTPALNVALPVGANLEATICKATANIKPEATLSAPIKLDPAHHPPLYWEGLCLVLSGKANLALTCCGLGLDKSVNLFDPIKVGSCSVGLHGPGPGESLAFAPPRHASIAFSPAGFALAVWEGYTTVNGQIERTSPAHSVFDGESWSPPQPIAGPEFAGWEPQVTFLDPRRAVVIWVRPSPGGAGLAGPTPHGACDTIGYLLEWGCGVVGGVVDLAESVWDAIWLTGPSVAPGRPGLAISGTWQPPTMLSHDRPLDLRPVLTSDPATGDAVLVWLREQEAIPGRQQALALYYARRGRGGWSAPERVDPLSNAFDLQPSLRFDRRGQPSLVWVRDEDGDLGTPRDRTLVFSTLSAAGWSAPETLAGLPPAPWTPALDFDQANAPLVAFVVPAEKPETGELLSADGLLSTLHVAQRGDQGWSATSVGTDTHAEAPQLRVTADNRALVIFRGFGTYENLRPQGDVTAAVADLGAAEPAWGLTRLTKNDRLNWQVAAEVNPETGEPLVLWESRDPADMMAEPELHTLPVRDLPDLTFTKPQVEFSDEFPTPGRPARITVRIANTGVAPLGMTSCQVQFFDREPLSGVTPFATEFLRGPLATGQERTVTVDYTPSHRAWRTFYVRVDAGETVPEYDESNNQAEGSWGGLPAPKDIVVTPDSRGGAMRLEWTNSVADGSVRTWIWRTRVGSRESELVGIGSGESFVDSLPEPGADYTYRLAAFDAQGEGSTAAETGPVIVPAPEPLNSETLRVSVLAFQGAVTLTWNALPAVQLEAAATPVGESSRWVPATEGVQRVGGIAQVTLPAVQGQQFFRLFVR